LNSNKDCKNKLKLNFPAPIKIEEVFTERE